MGVDYTTANSQRGAGQTAPVTEQMANTANAGGNAFAGIPNNSTAAPSTGPYDPNNAQRQQQLAAAGNNTSTPPPTPPPTPYTVQKGDTLSGIAATQGMSMADILKNNPSITDPNKISAGAQLSLGQQSPFKQGFNSALKTGTASPQTGSPMGNTQQHMPQTPDQPQPPPTSPNVDNFFQNSQGVQDATQKLMDFLNPQNTRDQLFQQMSQVMGDQKVLGQDKLQLMNVNTIMKGTEQDIRDEITKSGGMATNSQVLALTVSRNKTLLAQQQFLQDQVSVQQDLVNNDTTMLNFEKDMANTQFTQRMGVMQLVQTNQNNIQNAARNAIDTAIKTPGGLQAYVNDPSQAAYAEQVMGYAPGTIAQMNAASQKDLALKNAVSQSTIAKNFSDINKNNLDTSPGQSDTYKYISTIPDNQKNVIQPSLGGLSKAGLVNAAQLYLADNGKMPSLGLGSAAGTQAKRNAIINYAGGLADSMGLTLPQISAMYKANSTSANQVIQRVAKIDAVSNSLVNQFPRLAQLAGQVGNLGISEQDLTATKAQIEKKFNNPAANNYIELINTVRADYAAMQAAISGGRGGEQYLETAQKAIPIGASPEVYNGLAQTIQTSAANAQRGTQDEANKLISSIGNPSNASSNIDNTNTTINGLTATGSWGTLTFPDAKSLESFKTDHKL